MVDWDFDDLSVFQWILFAILVLLVLILIITLICAIKYCRIYRRLTQQHDTLAREKRLVATTKLLNPGTDGTKVVEFSMVTPKGDRSDRFASGAAAFNADTETQALKHAALEEATLNSPHSTELGRVYIEYDRSETSNNANNRNRYYKSQPTLDYGNEHHIHDMNDATYAGSDLYSIDNQSFYKEKRRLEYYPEESRDDEKQSREYRRRPPPTHACNNEDLDRMDRMDRVRQVEHSERTETDELENRSHGNGNPRDPRDPRDVNDKYGVYRDNEKRHLSITQSSRQSGSGSELTKTHSSPRHERPAPIQVATMV